MATRYSQNFTLTDIFNNKRLKGKIPLINYKETEREDGKISRRTNLKTINRLVFDISTSAARPYYKPIVTHRSGDIMIIEGNLVGDHNSAVDAVYNALQGQVHIMSYTVNNADIIRSALKEAEKNKRKYGIDTKLYLRAQSMTEIEGMTKRQISALIDNVMENIFYGDDFPETQKKYNVGNLPMKAPYDYKQQQAIWKQRVGDI